MPLLQEYWLELMSDFGVMHHNHDNLESLLPQIISTKLQRICSKASKKMINTESGTTVPSISIIEDKTNSPVRNLVIRAK